MPAGTCVRFASRAAVLRRHPRVLVRITLLKAPANTFQGQESRQRRPLAVERFSRIIGGIAGWLAEQFMKSDMGLLMNIVLGIVGAAIASAILSVFGIVFVGWIGYLIAGFIGACLLIWIVRAVRGRTA